ncbi:MAG: DEAD/DEAH box helicase family protein [Dehalococcoidales bacterium]|nr:DEAD/DEAH box helicase family protein [Dehalococcoidales bacterium]
MPDKKQSTFITNTENKVLKDRISQLISISKELKFLVGFFYFSGIRELYESIQNNPDVIIRVLVGLNVDKQAYGLVEYGISEKLEGNKHQLLFKDSVIKSINSDEFDTKEFYEQAQFFIQAVIDNKLIIRKTREPNHAKLYFFKMKDEQAILKPCCFITGSSNLTRAGLSEQNELNVEITDYGTADAEEYFDDLWSTSVKITEDDAFKYQLVKVLKEATLIAEVTPYEAFAFILKTYLELHKPKGIQDYVFKLLEKNGYKRYTYQNDAVSQALSIIEKENGVIISDVVGLGKSIIAGMVAKCLYRRGLIICPPALKGDIVDGVFTGWERYVNDFELNGWKIMSCGLETLEDTLKLVQNEKDFDIVIIDEAHRFRNQDTEAYQVLSNICRDKKVILLTATPFNNTPADIFSMLKLFIVPGKSNLTLSNNLDERFRQYNQIFKRLSNIKKNHNAPEKAKRDSALTDYKALFESDRIDLKQVNARSKYLANDIRDVISPVTIRRNRIDLKTDPVYSKEVYELSEVKDPCEAFFELTPEQLDFYDRVISTYFGEGGEFKGTIYRPFEYEAGIVGMTEEELNKEENREALIQKNLYDFMRRLLVKRFESSFGAFRQSIENFKHITEVVQQFIAKSNGQYVLDRKFIDKMSQAEDDEIQEALTNFEQELLTNGVYSKKNKVYRLNEKSFKQKDLFLADIESDLELYNKILKELDDLKLVSNDPKLAKLEKDLSDILKIKNKASEPDRKVIIFSEYTDTVKYVERYLEKKFSGQIISVKGDLNKVKTLDIMANFDTTYKYQKNDCKILLTTDKMSEGVNLNRAGAVINVDIPWNPTRVIQRVGRINRISKKVFDFLYIYNFFPTLKGSTIVKSRQIAGEKMFMIHNTLGEDSKVFDASEEPTASKLFEKVQQNPEEMEQESFQTGLRRMYAEIDAATKQKIAGLPSRIKTAKKYNEYNLTVFIRKGMGLFIRNIAGDSKEPAEMLFEDALPLIRCTKDEPALPLSDKFWSIYPQIKELKEKSGVPASELSVEKKAFNIVKTMLADKTGKYQQFQQLLNDLCEDILDYKTLSDFTLRRIANLDVKSPEENKIKAVQTELAKLQMELGLDYLSKVKDKVGRLEKEVIVAVENIKDEK